MDVIFTHRVGLDVQMRTVTACRVTLDSIGRQAEGPWCSQANIKSAAAVTCTTGASVRTLSAAVVAGRADPATMAALAKGWMWIKMKLLEQALTDLAHDYHRLERLGYHVSLEAAPASQQVILTDPYIKI
jgi:hypothetical protein